MSCGICGKPGDAPFLLQSGRNIGTTCGGDRCGSLLWESAVCPGDTKDERDSLGWRIRRHLAAVHGRPFTEPAPQTKTDEFFRRFDELQRMAVEMAEEGVT